MAKGAKKYLFLWKNHQTLFFKDTMTNQPFIVGLGEVLWDCLPDGPRLGGAPANFAYHVARLGFPARIVSAVGKDVLGIETLAALSSKGLEGYLPQVEAPTGMVKVNLDAHGVPSYEICEGVAWDYIPFSPALESLAEHCAAVCWGTLAQRHPVSQQTIHRFLDHVPADCWKVFDINLRQHYYSWELIEASLIRCDILKINDEELEIVARLLGRSISDVEKFCKEMLETYRLKILVLTCGAKGSSVFTKEGVSHAQVPKVKVVDTVGAGDAFTAAFVVSLLSGTGEEKAHQKATEVSAYVCTHEGGMG